jgi:hypothetical protein
VEATHFFRSCTITHLAEAAERGWVDHFFPEIIVRKAMTVEMLNFRRHLDSILE